MLDPAREENEEYLIKMATVMITAILALLLILEISFFVSYTTQNLVFLISSSLILMGIVSWQMGKINFRYK